MSNSKEMTLSTLSGLAVFVLVTLRYLLMFFNIIFLVLLTLTSIGLIIFLIWINV